MPLTLILYLGTEPISHPRALDELTCPTGFTEAILGELYIKYCYKIINIMSK